MPKKIVRVPYCVWLDITVETDSEDEIEIIEQAMEHARLSDYAGNGARHGKLIGTSEANVVIEAEEDCLEGERKFEIEVVDAE